MQNISAEYWAQVENQVHEQMLKSEVARNHDDYWERQQNL